MELKTKPDFGKTLQRFEAWWVGQIIDRPPIEMSVASETPVQWPQKQHATKREAWMDMEHRLARQEAAVASRKWVADSIPSIHGNLGPEVLATLYGAELEFTDASSWSKPILHTSRDVLKLKPNLDNESWTWERSFVKASLERGHGKWITSVTDLHTHADLMAALREPQELLMDLVDDRQGVKEAIRHVTPLFDLVYDDQTNAIQAASQPVMSWINAPHMGRGCVIQADFICMISPEMFQDVFLPPIRYETERLDRSIFHLDGPTALQHLDALLDLPKLHAIQWVYGAGNGPAARWGDVHRRIQSAGKSMQIICEGIPDALAVAEQLKPQGSFFSVSGEYDESEVAAFCRRMETWAAGGGLK